MEEQVVVEGVIEDIIYQNKDNGYTVCTINYEGLQLTRMNLFLLHMCFWSKCHWMLMYLMHMETEIKQTS